MPFFPILPWKNPGRKEKGSYGISEQALNPRTASLCRKSPRLARSTQQLCEIIDLVREKRLRLVIVGSITLDCREGRADPVSEAFLQMAGVFSQLELAMIRTRVRSGMANAKAKGKQIGRPQVTADSIPAIFLRHYPAYKNGQFNVSELARVCDLSRTTVYKYLSLLEG